MNEVDEARSVERTRAGLGPQSFTVADHLTDRGPPRYYRAAMSSTPSEAPATARRLGLEPHPEGGWYRQTWRSPVDVTLPDGRVRPTATLIWFLLPAGESSAWHRVASDELWLAHTGTVVLELGGDGRAPAAGQRHHVGVGAGESSQVLVPAGRWQRTVPTDEEALVSCMVSPGFDFDDFTLHHG